MLSADEIYEQRNQPLANLPQPGSRKFEPTGSYDELLDIQTTLQETKDLISVEKVQMIGSLSQAIWHPELQLAEVTHRQGSHWLTMGHVVDKKYYLYPEEALYLLEIGAMEITYENIQISVQRGYYLLLKPKTEVTLEQYRVYSQLNSYGYKIVRHVKLNVMTKYEMQIELHKVGLKHKDLQVDDRKRKLSDSDSIDHKKQTSDAIINYRNLPVHFNEEDVLEKLQIFETSCDVNNVDVNIDYDIYFPPSGKMFKKSSLQLPKYRIRVCRGENPPPNAADFIQLTKEFEDDVPVLYAIVFPDFITYYSINSVNLSLHK